MLPFQKLLTAIFFAVMLVITASAETDPNATFDAAGSVTGNAVAAQAEAASAAAAVTADTGASGNTFAMVAIGGIVKAALGPNLTARFVEAALSLSEGLKRYALVLAGSLALASLLWHVLIAMANRESPIDAAIEVVIFASLVAFLISAYTMIVKDIVSIGDNIINNVSPGGLGVAIANFIDGYFFKVIDTVVRGFAGMASFTGWFVGAMDLIISAFFLVIAAYFAFLALIELIGVVLIGPVAIGVGIVLGPLFIACLVSPWTKSWFSSWINFILNGAVITAVVVVVVSLINTVIIATNPVAGGSLTAEALSLALISASLGKIFSNIPSMVDGLLPGRTGMKSITVKDLKESIKGLPGTGK